MTIAEWLGGYGALMSTFIAVRDFRRASSRLSLEVTEGREESRKSYCVFVRVANRTSRPIKLSWTHLVVYRGFYSAAEWWRYVVRYPTRMRLGGWLHAQLDDHNTERLPVTIQPLDSLDFVIPVISLLPGLGEGRQRVKFEAVDGLGRAIRSKTFTLHGLHDPQSDDEA